MTYINSTCSCVCPCCKDRVYILYPNLLTWFLARFLVLMILDAKTKKGNNDILGTSGREGTFCFTTINWVIFFFFILFGSWSWGLWEATNSKDLNERECMWPCTLRKYMGSYYSCTALMFLAILKWKTLKVREGLRGCSCMRVCMCFSALRGMITKEDLQ